jgi:hypothetical protein
MLLTIPPYCAYFRANSIPVFFKKLKILYLDSIIKPMWQKVSDETSAKKNICGFYRHSLITKAGKGNKAKNRPKKIRDHIV